MSISELEYSVVARVSTGNGTQRPVLCSKRPSPQETNLIFVLGEHVSRVIPIDDICHRMRTTVMTVRVVASKLRRKLHYDWIIESVPNEGMRLCYIGSALAEADKTFVKLNPEALRRTRVQSDETREKIRATQIRKEAYRHFGRVV